MKKIVSALNKKKVNAYEKADTFNHEGGRAFTTPNADRVEQIAMCGTMGNSFYASTKELVADAINVFKAADAEVLAAAIIKGRNEGFIRAGNILGLIFLSQKSIPLFEKAFMEVIKTGNDLEDYINMARKIRGFGRAIRRVMHKWIDEKTTPYYALKYRKQIADAVRISKYPGKKNDIINHFVMKKYFPDIDCQPAYDKFPQLLAYSQAVEALEKNDTAEAVKLITKNRLDVMSLVGTGEIDDKIWAAFAEVMPVMMTLKYLNKLDRTSALDKSWAQIKVKLTLENFKKAKVFPFRLFVAYQNISNAKARQHLANILDQYTTNYDWGNFNKAGSWAICPDVSGSMTSSVRGSSLTPAVVASLFSAFFYKGIEDCHVIPWSTEAGIYTKPKQDSVMTHIESMQSISLGGGTNMEKALELMIDKKIKVDNVMFITDSIEYGSGWLNKWVDYKARINSKATAFVLRVDEYNTSPIDQANAEKYDVWQIFGWSDNVVKYIDYILEKNIK